ncbi:MAG: aldehyde-activating protein [Bdellovibrionales bacterium RIFOXYC1_FULL_54_43]|nr:MAG: aldehyde-activating protein [Bdellovibrionales bacterium RIFOXYC1_FULL_54_43]OFZ81357.1 MAG: aldehyde-activating protein [Bdellovibrionales bacterium RIFOXYD1_FULL_55_31]
MHKGSCLCGAVRFEVIGELPQPSACHCTQCRKHTGHFEAGTDVPRSAVTIMGDNHITWFRTENVRRGFCAICGSSLFFDADGKDWIGIAMGAFDTPTNTKLRVHVFVANKGDYYNIADGLPQIQPPDA